MVKLRLKRMGRKKRPFYRIVVADARSPRDGKNIEEIGYYNPLEDPPIVKLDLDRVDYWIGNGAKPTTTVENIINKQREIQAQTQEQEILQNEKDIQEAAMDINDDQGATDGEELAYDMVDEAENLMPEGE